MKKRTVLFVAVATLLSSVLFAQRQMSPGNIKEVTIEKFSSLVVRNDVTIMLIEDRNHDSVRIEGNKKFLESVKVFQVGKTLIVSGKGHKRLKKEGIIYIPVRNLQNIQVNAAAKIISYNTLQSPVLNLLINGACTVDIVVNGRLNIRESDGYDFSYTRVPNNTNTLSERTPLEK